MPFCFAIVAPYDFSCLFSLCCRWSKHRCVRVHPFACPAPPFYHSKDTRDKREIDLVRLRRKEQYRLEKREKEKAEKAAA